MNALERHRQTWPGKTDEWLFERLDNELKQKVEEIHRLLDEKEKLSENNMSNEMDEFINKIDSLCWEYGYEIRPTDVRNEDGTHPTLTIHGKDGEKVRLIYIDGDGRGK